MHVRPALLPALGVFAAAARHQNFAHAAEELHLTASAVSHHVRKLESQLGVALFQRNARGVTLTVEGANWPMRPPPRWPTSPRSRPTSTTGAALPRCGFPPCIH